MYFLYIRESQIKKIFARKIFSDVIIYIRERIIKEKIFAEIFLERIYIYKRKTQIKKVVSDVYIRERQIKNFRRVFNHIREKETP